MIKPLTSTPILRRALRKRIRDFGCGRVEVHTAVLEAVTNDAEDASRLRALLREIAELTHPDSRLSDETARSSALHQARHAARLVANHVEDVAKACARYE